MKRYTEVEIKHGRISMIAVLGYLMPEVFRFPGCEGFDNGLGALSSIPFEGWLQLVAFIGAHELLLKPGTRDGALGPGDYGFGSEVLEGLPAEEIARRQTVERNNGRLAMFAIMGLLVQDYMFDKTPFNMIFTEGIWGPPVDFLIKDIPICAGTTYCAKKERTSRTIMRVETGRYAPVPGERSRTMPVLPGEEPEMSPSMPFLTMPQHLKGWVGGEKGFDPLGVTDALPVYLCREAELKHGRVCMLATLGWMATDSGWRFPADVFQDVSTLDAHDKMIEAGMMQPFLGTIFIMEVYSGWLILNGFEGKITRAAGDYYLGKGFLPKDENKAKEMQLKELENGRLAMLAFSGIVTMAVYSDKPWPYF